MPKWLLKAENKVPRSSITKHLVDTGHTVDPTVAFKVLFRATTGRLLRFAEAAAIRRRKPELCKQLNLVINLALPCYGGCDIETLACLSNSEFDFVLCRGFDVLFGVLHRSQIPGE
nr:unnamed protein product [Spirometra erinaceieuropaei]